MLGSAKPAGNIGLMIMLRDVVVRVRNIAAPGWIMLPVSVITRQSLPGDMVEIIDVDIDIIAVVRVAAVMIIIVVVIVIVMMAIVIIPVDAAEQGVGGGDAEAIAKTFDEAIGELFTRRRRQVDRRVGRVRPGAVNYRRVRGRHVHHVRIGGFDFNHLGERGGCHGAAAA